MTAGRTVLIVTGAIVLGVAVAGVLIYIAAGELFALLFSGR